MQNLVDLYHSTLDSGQPLPTVFYEFKLFNIDFCLGEVSMIVAPTGLAKTALALTYAQRINKPVLYLGPDTTSADMFARAAAIASQDDVLTVKSHINNGGKHSYDKVVYEWGHKIHMDIHPLPTKNYIDEVLKAFAVLYGDYPDLIVIDTLACMSIGDYGEDFATLRHSVDALSDIAHQLGSHVMILHHLVGEWANGNAKPTLQSIQGKVDKRANVILGLYNEAPGILGFTVLKNRGGMSRGDGTISGSMPIDLSHMRVGSQNPTMDYLG